MIYVRKKKNMEKAKVYFTKEITPESLIKIYEALVRLVLKYQLEKQDQKDI